MSLKEFKHRDNITTECEVFAEGETPSDCQVKFDNCAKKDRHDEYIPVNELKMENLPPECRTHEFMEGLKLRCGLTVKVLVNYTSPNRPATYIDSDRPYPYSAMRGSDRNWRTGTGYIRPDSSHFPIKGKPCPCPLCEESGDPKLVYLDVSVFTATHLVFDDREAVHSIFECFYDSEDRSDVRCLYGRTVTDPDELKRCVNDSCVVNCVTHDPVLIEKLLDLAKKRGIISLANRTTERGIIISHPHGLSKQVSIGKILYCGVHKDPRLPNDVPYEFGKDAKCRVPIACSESQNSHSSNEHKSEMTDRKRRNEDIASSSETKTKVKKQLCAKETSLLTPDTTVTPGNEYYLPPGMTFKLPLDSASFCTFPLPINYSSKLWVKFPQGTEFFLPDGKRIDSVPPETEFCWSKGRLSVNNKSCLYVTYDMVTCPGSSGATIFRCDNCWGLFPHFPHCGAQEDGKSRSSNIIVFCYYETWMAFPSIVE